MSNSKKAFIDSIQYRMKELAVQTIRLLTNVQNSNVNRVIVYQLTKSITSLGANYRACCRARSDKEFYSKMSIVVEEADESIYWLELIESLNLIKRNPQLRSLKDECLEILKITVTARNKRYLNN